MQMPRWIKSLLPLVLVGLLTLAACSSAPSKYDQAQQDTTGFKAPAAVEKGAEKGGTFNQFFPASEGEFSVVPSQEKQGFAEYKLKRDGETLAMLTINDTISLPAAAQKYEDATKTVAGFPAVEQGSTATGLLVNGRYQVKVLSRSDAFTASDRAAWLEKFDLAGLAKLEANTRAFRKVQKKQAIQERKAAVEPTDAAVTAPPAPTTQPESITQPKSTTVPNSTLETSPFLVPTPTS